jgi:gluconate kinase
VSVLRISLYGPTGSGKSTIARYITTKYNAELVKISDPLHRFQAVLYEDLGIPVSGQDGELLQFLAAKIEKECPGWLGRAAVKRIRQSTSSFIVNDDCRLNSYSALREANFIFIRVRTSPELLHKRLRQDHTVVNAAHDTEKGFEQIQMDYEIENNGPLSRTLTEVDLLVDRLMSGERAATPLRKVLGS